MKIGIIGAGNVGTGLGKRLAVRGHEVVVSFAPTAEGLAAAAQAIGGRSRTGTPEQAADFGDVVIVATPWGVTLEALAPVAAALRGKVVWDATNPLKPDMSGLVLGTTTSGGEEIAKALPGAKVVKAVPPFAEVLHSPSTHLGAGRPSVFACSDDADARSAVLALLADVDADGVDAGPPDHDVVSSNRADDINVIDLNAIEHDVIRKPVPIFRHHALALARYIEPLGMLLVQLAYPRGFGALIGAALLRGTTHA